MNSDDTELFKVASADSSPQDYNYCHVVNCYCTDIMLYSLCPMDLLLFKTPIDRSIRLFPQSINDNTSSISYSQKI